MGNCQPTITLTTRHFYLLLYSSSPYYLNTVHFLLYPVVAAFLYFLRQFRPGGLHYAALVEHVDYVWIMSGLMMSSRRS